MAREMSEHGAIGSNHLAFVALFNALLAHNALLAGGWTSQPSTSGREGEIISHAPPYPRRGSLNPWGSARSWYRPGVTRWLCCWTLPRIAHPTGAPLLIRGATLGNTPDAREHVAPQ